MRHFKILFISENIFKFFFLFVLCLHHSTNKENQEKMSGQKTTASVGKYFWFLRTLFLVVSNSNCGTKLNQFSVKEKHSSLFKKLEVWFGLWHSSIQLLTATSVRHWFFTKFRNICFDSNKHHWIHFWSPVCFWISWFLFVFFKWNK